MRATQSETTAPVPEQSKPKTRAGSGFGKPRQTKISSQTQQAQQKRTPSLFGPSNTVTNTNCFGATSGFGAATAGFGVTSQPATTTGLFGKPTTSFGVPATTSSTLAFNLTLTITTSDPLGANAQTKPFGGFSTLNTNTGLFGNQQNANTSLFGATNATPTFGQSTKPTEFGFGASTGTGLFGQTHQTTQQTTPSLFGPSNTAANTNLFGATSGFSGNNAAGGMTGTVVKFSPLTGSDTMLKNGVTQTISTRHYCITCMKEYEGKSLEELRLEDYVAGCKGQAQGAQTTGMFGWPAQPSIFGNTRVNTSTANTGFGAATVGFGVTSQPATTTGLFGKPTTSFGVPATTSSTLAFNLTITTTTSDPLGANAQAKPFGAAAPTPLFGTTNTTQPAATAFGTNNTNAFGSFGAPLPNQNIGLFNQNKPPSNMPASTASTGFSGFGQNTATNTTGGLFGAKPAGTASFGTTPSFGATPAPAFGTNTGFGTAPATGSLFNSSFKPAGQTGFSFGATPATSTGLEVSSGVNSETESSIVAPRKLYDVSFPETNTNSNRTNAFSLKNDFSVENKTAALRSNFEGPVFGAWIGPHSTSVLDQVNESVAALALDETEECLKSGNLAAQTSINPDFQVGTNKSSSNAGLQTVKKTQPSEKLLSMENRERLAVKVAESLNSTADEKKGANEESQTLRNSIDNQTDLQSSSKSTMSQSVNDDILNSTPNVDENLFSSSHSSDMSHKLDGTSVMSSYTKRRPNVACNTPRCAGYYVIPSLAAAPTPVFGSTNTTQPDAGGFGLPASTASTGFSGFGQNTATNTTGSLFGAKPAGTASFGFGTSFGATPAPAFGTILSFGPVSATGSLFNSSFKLAGQPRCSFGTPATSTGLEVSSGVNSGTESSIVAPRKLYDVSFPETNTNSNRTNAVSLKNDFSVKNKTAAPRSDPAGEQIGPHSTSVLDQVNESVAALALDETEECLKSGNLAAQTSINPDFQVGTNKSSSNAGLQTVKKTQPSEKLLSMENRERLAVKVAESLNSTADEKKGANEESQTLRNSIDNQTDLQSSSKSTMSQSVNDDILNSTPNVDENLLSSSHSSDTSHKLDGTSVMSSHTKRRPTVACNTPRCAGYYVIPPLEKLDEYVCGHTCMIPNFTRGLKGCGNYYQPHSFDIYGLDLDEIVPFRNEKIIIYPYDDHRQPIGSDLDHSAKALTEDMIVTDSPGLIFITSKWSRWSRR